MACVWAELVWRLWKKLAELIFIKLSFMRASRWCFTSRSFISRKVIITFMRLFYHLGFDFARKALLIQKHLCRQIHLNVNQHDDDDVGLWGNSLGENPWTYHQNINVRFPISHYAAFDILPLLIWAPNKRTSRGRKRRPTTDLRHQWSAHVVSESMDSSGKRLNDTL